MKKCVLQARIKKHTKSEAAISYWFTEANGYYTTDPSGPTILPQKRKSFESLPVHW